MHKTCFPNSCKLAINISDIIHCIYSRNTLQHAEKALREIEKRLDDWRSRTPNYMQMDLLNLLPNVSPQIHILAQKYVTSADASLYATKWYALLCNSYLIHRLFYFTPAYRLECRDVSHCLCRLVTSLEHREHTHYLHQMPGTSSHHLSKVNERVTCP
jgi:hypothetical protein